MDLDSIDFWDPITQFLGDKTFSVPLGQVLLFALLLTFCMLLGRHKLGLIVSYTFVFYWGFIFNRPYFVNMFGDTSYGLYAYGFFGLFMVLLAIVGLFQKSK
ncbi:MAG: hypothetical protein V3U37_05680 [Nitrospinaceae bacterium]